VLAETPNGALRIARYHYSRGAGFALEDPDKLGGMPSATDAPTGAMCTARFRSGKPNVV
jgi:hypothetical protein